VPAAAEWVAAARASGAGLAGNVQAPDAANRTMRAPDSRAIVVAGSALQSTKPPAVRAPAPARHSRRSRSVGDTPLRRKLECIGHKVFAGCHASIGLRHSRADAGRPAS